MSVNNHGLPSRVPAIAEIGRLLGDPAVADADKYAALQLLVQDHADLDEVEAQSALWAIAQMGGHEQAEQAREALLICAPQWLQMRDAALPFMDCYQALFGLQKADEASAVFAQLEILALQDAELSERLAQLR
ncbi:MAG: hypothetical protein RSE32_00635 [Comamonas sp.]|uniref:hypothetical protein n=1 Tax=Comamonas sp. TaxID=34028 RepID=UPI002FC791C8